jgi:hypothetical protein
LRFFQVRRYGNTGAAGSVGSVGVLLEFRDDVSSNQERSLPMAFRLRPWDQLKYLVMNKHSLVSILFYYSPYLGRHIRVAMVLVGIFGLMAMEALIYKARLTSMLSLEGVAGRGHPEIVPSERWPRLFPIPWSKKSSIRSAQVHTCGHWKMFSF